MIKLLNTIKQFLGLQKQPTAKEIKLEMLLYLRKVLKIKNGYMCCALLGKFPNRTRKITLDNLEIVLPELHRLRPLRCDIDSGTAWGTARNYTDEQYTGCPIEKEITEIWNYRKWAVECAIITLEKPHITFEPYALS